MGGHLSLDLFFSSLDLFLWLGRRMLAHASSSPFALATGALPFAAASVAVAAASLAEPAATKPAVVVATASVAAALTLRKRRKPEYRVDLRL